MGLTLSFHCRAGYSAWWARICHSLVVSRLTGPASTDRLDYPAHLRQPRWASILSGQLRGQAGLHAVAKRSELSRISPSTVILSADLPAAACILGGIAWILLAFDGWLLVQKPENRLGGSD